MAILRNVTLHALAALACSLCAAAPVAWTAPAEAPAAANSAPNAAGLDLRALGITESILHYCAPIDAEAAKRLRQRIAAVVHGASDATIARARRTAAYRQAYDSIVEFVAKVDPHNTKLVCAEPLAKAK